jgi:ornithine carbamoyltransferase
VTQPIAPSTDIDSAPAATAAAPRKPGAAPFHYLTGTELSAAELDALLARAAELKTAPLSSDVLAGLSVALLFQRPSTRTRVSFEAGIHELGGHPLLLRSEDLQLSRGESLRDTAYVLSRHVAALGVRTGPDAMLEELAAHASIPVFNMLTALHHPCQALADLLTVKETFGELAPLRLAYVGDGNNVARSLAALEDPRAAVEGAHMIYADVWVSMNDDDATASARRAALAPYRLDDALLDLADSDAIALHCLPAHPGEEIAAEVLYGPRQRIWEQAENRRHAQKALLELLVAGSR